MHHRFYLFTTVAALVLVAAGGCASTKQTQQGPAEKQARVEAILTQTSETADYMESERCLNANQYRHIQILDNQHIVFEGRRGQYWLNRLPMRCPGLRRGSTIAIERATTISSLCRLDSIAVYDWLGSPWYRRWPLPWGSGPKCALGEFQPITELQLGAIKTALATQR